MKLDKISNETRNICRVKLAVYEDWTHRGMADKLHSRETSNQTASRGVYWQAGLPWETQMILRSW